MLMFFSVGFFMLLAVSVIMLCKILDYQCEIEDLKCDLKYYKDEMNFYYDESLRNLKNSQLFESQICQIKDILWV